MPQHPPTRYWHRGTWWCPAIGLNGDPLRMGSRIVEFELNQLLLLSTDQPAFTTWFLRRGVGGAFFVRHLWSLACGGHSQRRQVGLAIKNSGRHAPAFPGVVAGSGLKRAPHPTEETTNVPRPRLRAQGANLQKIRGHLLRIAIPDLATRQHPAEPATKAVKQAEWMHQITQRLNRKVGVCLRPSDH